MKQLLVVVDMQRDFVTGALGTAQAQKIIPAVVRKIEAAVAQNIPVAYTMDTHGADYFETEEGRNLPVAHCVKGTQGWELVPELVPLLADATAFEKPTFGSAALAEHVKENNFTDIEFVGVCTGICVISNAIVVKTINPEARLAVDSACCACVTPESHATALAAMGPLQIKVYEEGCNLA